MTNFPGSAVTAFSSFVISSFVIALACVSWANISALASAENGEVNEHYDSQPKQKGVGLEIADLEQAQKRADSKRSAACAADCAGINDPAIEESGDAGQQLL